MSTPIYNGGLVGAIDEQGRPFIPDDGNWSLQGDVGGPAFRALALYVNGTEAFGYRPSVQREQFSIATIRPGVCTREVMLAWRGPVLAPGSRVEMIVTGGNRYQGWGDTAGEDWMEWGSLSPSTLEPVVASTGVLTVPSPDPVPSPPVWGLFENEDAAVAILYELVEQWRHRAGLSDEKIADTLHYQVILALRARGPVRQELKEAIRRVLEGATDG